MVFFQWVIASVNSKEENDFINSLAQGSNFWIDGRRTCDGSGNSCWQWSGLNHKNSYYNWAEGEPNNYGGNEEFKCGTYTGGVQNVVNQPQLDGWITCIRNEYISGNISGKWI